MKVKGKKGLEMAITTVLMIVLSISVLTILIIFFNSQTSFFSKFFDSQKSESNVDLLISSCSGLVTTQSTYSYCCEEKEVDFGDDKDTIKITCSEASKLNWSSGKIGELKCGENICV